MLFDLEESFSMTSSLHLRWTLFQLLEGLSNCATNYNQPGFLNIRDVMGFVGNSYKVVNAIVERHQLFSFFSFFFS